jgi:hypothetical protein
MTSVPVSAPDTAAAIARRQRRLQHLRETLAANLWSEWLTTAEGVRYVGSAGADRGRRAGIGWAWCANQVRIMANVMDDAITRDGEAKK